MTCKPCQFVGQLVANAALLLDHAGNTLLLGDPNETMSRRFARARNAGSKSAAVVCWILTRVFGAHGDKDHCIYAMDASKPSLGRELWGWDNNTLE